MFVVPYIVCAFICYLLGSIPSGFLAGRMRGIDIRKEGSGNIGATNVVRVLGKPVGIAVCILDMLKGWLGVVVVAGAVGKMFAGGDPEVSIQALKIVAGVATILGHNFTCWLRFKGGKGVATTGGVVIAWFPLSFLVVTVVWFLFFFATRYVSVASIASATALPFAAWRLNGQPLMIAMAVAVSALVIFRHRANIGRLMAGTENRFERKKKGMKVTVLGAGAWGTALAKILAEGGHDTTLWGRDPEKLELIRSTSENKRLLPGVKLPQSLQFNPSLEAAMDSDILIVSVPSQGLAEVVAQLGDFRGIVVSTTKGVDFESGLTMTGIIARHCPQAKVAAMSGPTIAVEVAMHGPSAIVAASEDPQIARTVQRLFSSPTFRVYSSTDVLGVQLGGALKNVFAIAAGAGDGLGFGDNAKAALITRSIAEMRRLGAACGVQPETFAGLSGLGDLTVTCFSRHSRNRQFGERLGRGESLAEVQTSMISVVEGYPAARSVWKLAKEAGVESPIINEVRLALYEGKDARLAVRDLMTRELKAED